MPADEWHPISEELRWRGAIIDVRYNPKGGFTLSGGHIALHVLYPEIRYETQETGNRREFLVPRSDALPVTVTGYRSEFTQPGKVEEAGGLLAYVTAWLDREAVENKPWAKRFGAGAQLELF